MHINPPNESGWGEEGAKPIIQCSARDLLWNVNRSGCGVNGRRRIEIFDVFFPAVFSAVIGCD